MATEERPVAAPTPLGDAHTVETVEEVIRARLSAALGGIRGSVETALPTVAFIAAWVWRHDVRTAVAASAVVALVLLVSRLVARQTPRYVLSAVAATAVAAFFALRSGRAEDAFLPGILASAGWGAAALVSVIARWPVVGFLVAAGRPPPGRRPARVAARPGPGAGVPAADDGPGRALRRCASRSCCPCTSPVRSRCWASPRSSWGGRPTSAPWP